MGLNHKTIIMRGNKTGIDRAVYGRPVFGTAYVLLHQFLSFTTLSRKNILWAEKRVQDIRSNPAMDIENLETQEKLIQLDKAVNEAKMRLQRREDRRARIKAKEEAEAPKPKKDEPEQVPAPASDKSAIWAAALADREKQEKKS